MRILLVEDDPIQLALAQRWLEDAGYRVTGLRGGSDALRALGRDTFDLAILDWMLPDVPGDQVLAWIRQHRRRMPVMFATARDEEEEIAAMLRGGADDYVVKPLRRLEFAARVEAVARRAGLLDRDDDEPLEMGPYRLDPLHRAVYLAGEPVKMTPRMVEVALLFFRRAGELVSRDHLYEEIWGRQPGPDTRTVDTHVSRVRNALELDGRHGLRLASVYQHGYRLEQAATR